MLSVNLSSCKYESGKLQLQLGTFPSGPHGLAAGTRSCGVPAPEKQFGECFLRSWGTDGHGPLCGSQSPNPPVPLPLLLLLQCGVLLGAAA